MVADKYLTYFPFNELVLVQLSKVVGHHRIFCGLGTLVSHPLLNAILLVCCYSLNSTIAKWPVS